MLDLLRGALLASGGELAAVGRPSDTLPSQTDLHPAQLHVALNAHLLVVLVRVVGAVEEAAQGLTVDEHLWGRN